MSTVATPEVDVVTPTVLRAEPTVSVYGSIPLNAEARYRLDIDVAIEGPEGGCIKISHNHDDNPGSPFVNALFLRDDHFAAFRVAMEWAFAELDRMRPMARELFVNPGETYSPCDDDES